MASSFEVDNRAPSGLPDRAADAHKGTFGYDVIVGGSVGMAGACVLAAKGALRSGAGVVQITVPEGAYEVVASQVTCPLVHPVPDTFAGTFHPDAKASILEKMDGSDAAAVGPGMGTRDETRAFLFSLLPDLTCPTVVDADGLNVISEDVSCLDDVRTDLVLTPHPGEFSRLTGDSIEEIQSNRASVAADFASKHDLVLVLKGHETVVTDGDRVWINETGNPGMATGGTGDVLTGMLTSFIGQGMNTYEAARLGVFLHGLSGDQVADEKGMVGMIASDLVAALPNVLKEYKVSGK